ncbi:MAG: hypothetical protein DRO88_08175 [Promethearchaeia archaeon]|nr:MAG: hypothetical protein DRO88_08175 [Candidatus Lokiarchaeia archaeon]
MEDHVTRFVSHEYRNKEFEKMVKKISAEGGISVELTRKFTKEAMHEWEQQQHQDVLTLFTAQPQTLNFEISKMLENLRDKLRPVIISKKRIDRAVEIAANCLENMYHIL